MPQFLPLTNTRTGGATLGDWVSQASQTPVIDSQWTTLFPVQEMLPFQRQILTREIEPGVSQGENVLFEATVPDDEAWRLHFVSYFHDDNTNHTVRLAVVPRLQTVNGRYPYVRQQIREDIDTPLYPSMATSGTTQNNFFNQRGGKQPELFAGDAISLLDETARADAVAGVARILFRYERIPLPLTIDIDQVWTVQTF